MSVANIVNLNLRYEVRRTWCLGVIRGHKIGSWFFKGVPFASYIYKCVCMCAYIAHWTRIINTNNNDILLGIL